MPRRRKLRMVAAEPKANFFKPSGVHLSDLKGVILPVEGLEAMRLCDLEGLSQEAAAGRMGVSTPTFCRVLAEARRVVALALSEGFALRIEGGDYRLAGAPAGPGEGAHPGRGHRRRRGGGDNQL